jgi:hypothetical protein
MRTIKLMADYHCFPLWEVSNSVFGNIDPNELPISKELKQNLTDWALSFDKTLNQYYPPDSGFEKESDEIYFKNQAVFLQNELIKKLGNSFIVQLYIGF